MVTAGFSKITAATVSPKQYPKQSADRKECFYFSNEKKKIQRNLIATLPATATQLQPSLDGKQSDSDRAKQHYSSRSIT